MRGSWHAARWGRVAGGRSCVPGVELGSSRSLQGGRPDGAWGLRGALNPAALRGYFSSQSIAAFPVCSLNPGSEQAAFLGPACGPHAGQQQGQDPSPAARCLRRPPAPTPASVCCGLSTRFVVGRRWRPGPGSLGRGAGAGSPGAPSPVAPALPGSVAGLRWQLPVPVVTGVSARGQEGPRGLFLGVNVRVCLE